MCILNFARARACPLAGVIQKKGVSVTKFCHAPEIFYKIFLIRIFCYVTLFCHRILSQDVLLTIVFPMDSDPTPSFFTITNRGLPNPLLNHHGELVFWDRLLTRIDG